MRASPSSSRSRSPTSGTSLWTISSCRSGSIPSHGRTRFPSLPCPRGQGSEGNLVRPCEGIEPDLQLEIVQRLVPDVGERERLEEGLARMNERVVQLGQAVDLNSQRGRETR